MGLEVPSANMGAVGTMMHGMSHAGTCGHVKADDDNAGANVGMHELCGEGDRHGRRIGGMWKCVEMRKSKCV